jgi:hypothetical protein
MNPFNLKSQLTVVALSVALAQQLSVAQTNEPPAAPGDDWKPSAINSDGYESPLTGREWRSWRRSLHEFVPLLFND